MKEKVDKRSTRDAVEFRKKNKRKLRDEFNDKKEEIKLQKELNKSTVFVKIENFNFASKFFQIKTKLLKKLFNIKKIIYKKIEQALGKEILKLVLSTVSGGAAAPLLDALKRAGASGADIASVAELQEALKQIETITNKINLAKNPLQFIENKNQEIANIQNKKLNEELEKENPFCKFKSSWMDTGCYDKDTYQMYVETKIKHGKKYAFVVNGVTERMWDMIKDADGSGKMLWDTAWASKRTKSVGAYSHTGKVRVNSMGGWS